jgi:hypothetical protein
VVSSADSPFSGNKISPSNAQLTHVLLTGTSITSPSTHNDNAESGTEDQAIAPATEEHDVRASIETPVKRSWALKVVRREAVIAAHTFLLKEIYGLASASAAETEPASLPNDMPDPYASTPNECIVCLTNARDVVLLPCRHLVVCRECALGMIEFGAGGKVARREDTNPSDAVGSTGATGTGGVGDAVGDGASAPAPAPTTRERRKRKAKGWFCPVCRQREWLSQPCSEIVAESSPCHNSVHLTSPARFARSSQSSKRECRSRGDCRRECRHGDHSFFPNHTNRSIRRCSFASPSLKSRNASGTWREDVAGARA